ncbi:hypothetical protein [Enhygromyxa salina]|uniref:Uncharacterized protein n=1 Tax=Enhygromyxa salina TaxID=215803 RepID=A0A2S9YAC6_9BACT|nr:hypothetical protein [Enhygromyxa salina]PRQ02057.1 hypothetical protein ENSA7_56300 [Enhygromyxa salina]
MVGVAIGVHVLRRGPSRAEVVHTTTLDGWTGRVIQRGPWSEENRAWTGPTTFDIELLSPDNGVRWIRTSIRDLDRAIGVTMDELHRAAAKQRRA